MRRFDQQTLEKVVQTTDPRTGLSSAEVSRRREQYGPNELQPEMRHSAWYNLLRPLRDPMVLLLLGAGIIYLFLGDTLNASIMLLAIIPIAGVDVALELRAERALEQLNKLSALHAEVKRESRWLPVAATDLVPGDIVRITEGTIVPADGFAIHTNDLQIDESLLTGESLPVAKEGTPWALDGHLEEANTLLAGTTVLSGRGDMVAVYTGKETLQGEIGTLVAAAKPSITPTERIINQLVKYLSIGAVFLVVGVAGIELLRGNSLTLAITSAVSLGIAAIPEEFVIIFVLFLALGAQYMASRNALIRRLPAVEALGSVNIIATDKTGTLTLGQLALAGLYVDHSLLDATNLAPTPAVRQLMAAAVLASEPNPFDPLERAILAFAPQAGIDITDLYKNRQLIHEYRFESQRRYMSHIWQTTDGKTYLYAKGAIEALLPRSNIGSDEKQRLLQATDELGGQGMRVIAVAQRALPTITNDREIDERGLDILGLVGLSDPPRPGAKEAVETAQCAGVRVLMVTGDHPRTAHAIAEMIGMTHEDDRVVTGAQMEELSEPDLHHAAKTNNIFARVLPKQKDILVGLLKSEGNVVAVTGDGVNDAPALRRADIGIAMGKRGTEVARAAASMVLLDDNFLTIINAIREGRRIFDNLQKAFRYLLAFHIPVVLTAFLIPLLGLPLLLLPIHLVWLELVVHPTASLVYISEPAAPNTMRRPPRQPDTPFLTRIEAIRVISLGTALLALILAIYLVALSKGQSVEVARSLALAAFILGNAAVAYSERTQPNRGAVRDAASNPLAIIVLALAVISFFIIVYTPLLATAFQIQPPQPILWLVPIAAIALWIALAIIVRRALGIGMR